VQSVSYRVTQAGEWEEGEQITGRVTMFGDLKVNAVLNLVAGTDAYLTVTCEKVIITSVQVGYNTGDTRPTENITLSYRKATWRYGTATTSYNLEAATD